MRILGGPVSFAAALVAIFSSAHASQIYQEPNPFAKTEGFALKFGSAPWGIPVIEGFRTIDGKSFYHDDSSTKLRDSAALFVAAAGFSSDDSRPTFSSNSFGSNFSSPGGFGSASFFGGGNEGTGPGGGAAPTTGGAGGAASMGLNPFESAYTNLGADYGGLGGDGKGEVSVTPLPDTLPLFASGLVLIGMLGWSRKRTSTVFPVAPLI